MCVFLKAISILHWSNLIFISYKCWCRKKGKSFSKHVSSKCLFWKVTHLDKMFTHWVLNAWLSLKPALCFQALKVAYFQCLFYIFMGFNKVSPIKTDPPLQKIKPSTTGKTVVLDPFYWTTLRFYVPPLGRWSVTDYTTIVFNRASIKTKLLKGAAKSTSLELTVQNTSFHNQYFLQISAELIDHTFG